MFSEPPLSTLVSCTECKVEEKVGFKSSHPIKERSIQVLFYFLLRSSPRSCVEKILILDRIIPLYNNIHTYSTPAIPSFSQIPIQHINSEIFA